jgi:hypothetical protein
MSFLEVAALDWDYLLARLPAATHPDYRFVFSCSL